MAARGNELFELRQQAHYWRTMHGRAAQRESVWKEKIARLKTLVRVQKTELSEATEVIEVLKARIAWLERQVFGGKGEQSKDSAPRAGEGGQSDGAPSTRGAPGGGRRRGQQPGRKSAGRRLHPELPAEQIIHELAEPERCCARCGLPFDDFPGTEDSEEIHWGVRVVRRVHRRKRYRPRCKCPGVPGIITAPVPARLIPKGKFTTEFWVRVLEQKYRFQIPLHRTLKMLEAEGVRLAQGTLTDGLKRLAKLIQPLYARIIEHSRKAGHWQMDETRWMVFEDVEGKQGHRWWLWIVVTRDTCVYLLDPTRSGAVPKNFLGEGPQGVISADRYSAYKSLLSTLLSIAYCWAHVRRDFGRLRDGYPKLRAWGTAWVERIDALFHCNAQRIAVRADPELWGEHEQALRQQMDALAQLRDQQLADKTLLPAARKALESMNHHWEGLSLFVDNPELPMDNNRAERGLRGPVVGRKNYYGSGSVWSGMLSVMLFTLFQTLEMNQADPHEFLLAYFEACARNQASPPENLDDFVAWRWGPEKRQAA
jgi:transposase